MNKYKKQFPIFKNNPKLIYLDSAATSLKPQRVIDKEVEYYQNYSANVGRGMCDMAMRATEEYEKTRELVAKFVGATNKEEIVFTHGATEGINLVARGWGENNLKAGDEIVLTEVEHHANLLPWLRLAETKKLKIKYLPVDDGSLGVDWPKLEAMVSGSTKLVALTHQSNVTGLLNPVGEIISRIRAINQETVVVVDGAQAVGHHQVNASKMDTDFYAFSGHKMYGPTGVGVVYGKAKRWEETQPLIVGGGAVADADGDRFELREAPYKFEAGTPPIAQVVGLGRAAEFIGWIGWSELKTVEDELARYAFDKLSTIEGVTIIGNKESRIITFAVEGIHPHDIGDFLGRKGICVRAGHHCCLPLHKKLKLMATTRLSFGIYNTVKDVDRAVKAVVELKNKYVKK